MKVLLLNRFFCLLQRDLFYLRLYFCAKLIPYLIDFLSTCGAADWWTAQYVFPANLLGLIEVIGQDSPSEQD